MTKRLAYAAVCAALAVGILALGQVMPTATLGITALAGVCTGICVLLAGKRQAALAFLAAGALAFVLLPDKTLSLSFLLFFGHYPLVKAWAERRKPLGEWAVKLAVFNAAVVLWGFLLWRFFTLPFALPQGILLPVSAVLGNIVFVLYDFELSKLLSFLERRLARFFG